MCKLKQQVAQQQQTTITQFYDYKEGYAELDRFNNVEAYREDLMNALESYDKMQSKEARFLTLYDYMLNIIAMIAIFATLALGFIQLRRTIKCCVFNEYCFDDVNFIRTNSAYE